MSSDRDLSSGAATLEAPPSGVAPTVAGPGATAVDVRDVDLEDHGFEHRYLVEELLGEGGMGEVRRCTDVRIGREVAMKLVRGGGELHPDARARFVREARVQGRLEHPSIVPVHDVGLTASKRLFFTMKRVRGRTLADVLSALAAGEVATTEAFSRRKLLAAFCSVCLAVDFAHQRGVVHRDLKPANVMLGDFGEVYVLDWGIAKVGATDVSNDASDADVPQGSTRRGAIMGTPGYMSPEQAMGRIDAIDARLDVYALGVMLFELLALEPLHRGARTEDVLASTLRGEIELPSARSASREIPPELDAVCAGAIARDPAHRTPTARALNDAIERFLDGDRDLEQRRRLAREHAARAVAEAELAFSNDPRADDGRARAMRDVGRALAFDPENPDAMRTMVSLLTTPPDKLPTELAAEIEASAITTARVAGRAGAYGFLAMLVFVPMAAWMGIRSWSLLVAAFGTILAAVALNVAMARTTKRPIGLTVGVMLCCVTLVTIVTRLFGPLVGAPTLALSMAVAAALHPGGGKAWHAIATGTTGIILPFALELFGVLEPSYAFTPEGMQVLPHLASFPPAPTLLYLFMSSTLTVAAVAAYLARLRTALETTQRQLHIQAWQLRQIVPADPASSSA